MASYVHYMFQENSDCLSLALRTAKREYVLLVTLLPIAFLILEIIHVITIINNNPVTEAISVARTVISIIASLAFFWLFLGGLQEYLTKGYRDARSVWWVVQGLEECILFALVAIFQNVTFENDDITTSFWFWAILDVLLCIVVWVILSAGKPKIPDQRWVWWVKSAQLVWISAWLGYRPNDKTFDAATVVTLMVCLLLAYVYYSRSKAWGIAITLVPGLFFAAFLIKNLVNDALAVEWIFLVAMVIALVLYIMVIVRANVGFEEDTLPSI